MHLRTMYARRIEVDAPFCKIVKLGGVFQRTDLFNDD